MKPNIRTIGIDDAAFKRGESTKTFVFGVVVRGNNLVEGILRSEIKIDGWDATEKISEMITKSRFSDQLKAIFLNSSTIGAFNLIDLNELHEKTTLPAVILLAKAPNSEDFIEAISHLSDGRERYKTLQANPPTIELNYKNQIGRDCSCLVQQVGFSRKKEIKELLYYTSQSSCIPECLRIADLIGRSFKDYTF
ncbi:MAG: endonuclease dU [Candidatus Heimdallarchaeaceae archaeon]